MNASHPPTRAAGLERLARFVPAAGRDYAAKRNYDLPGQGHPHVSQLSPYLRHRLVTEEEVLEAVLERYSLANAEKFVAEVCWRTYWKGWLELRPSAWAEYRRDLDHIDRTGVAKAEAGQTDIDAFNAWTRELVETGYLHNHARMWFASIWIFTLGLPWQAGADFFMRHLLDGDPASNTLSWRWVAGLQTHGKHYVARSSNISKYTDGRHNPEWRLNTQAEPLSGPPHPVPRAAPVSDEVQPGLATAILLHDDDLAPDALTDHLSDNIVGLAGLLSVQRRSPQGVSPLVAGFALGALDDAVARWGQRFGQPGPIMDDGRHLVDWAKSNGIEQIVTPYAPTGPTSSALRRLRPQLDEHGIDLVQIVRAWDRAAWSHATHGFFRFKKHIPDLLSHLTLDRDRLENI
ncbi:FAD-binding domain-containing protein [Jannaschia sp. CCS1]|uniref:FAD-binding domain-containing protein n=1 Tax=Jannaschia sp. (strain CCS1) TaxID=290400 RepID=UPI000053AA7D|nr:FAD-binding domain-containing protein [Jannaschia sp. CCS1]ABD55726.1 deoxyribodipyrimidine photo-lyase family protein (cryptochrome) [Jannaschia sp. CCS1]